MKNFYLKRIFALIPESLLKEASDCSLEFKSVCNIKEGVLLVTVRDEENKTINGVQFIADLKISPLVTGGD